MSYLAKLYVDGKEYKILHCTYLVYQQTNAANLPSNSPSAGMIDLRLESDSSTDFFDWAIHRTKVKNGYIVFYDRDSISTQKRLDFTNAYCVDYAEEFDSNNSGGNVEPMVTSIVLSAKVLKLEDSEFENAWPG